MKPKANTLPKPTENEIQSAIRGYLRLRGWFVIRNQQGLGSHKGLSDLTAIKDGRVLWIEVKKPGGRLSRYQAEFADQVVSHGGEYVLADSVEVITKEVG